MLSINIYICLWWRRLSGDRTVVNFTMWSWVGLNVFMLIWRECLVLGDVAASEHGVGWGGGGMGWAYNVHVGCRKDVMLRHATVWRCWSNFRDALDATLWRCWSNFRDALDATLWRCWSNFRDALDATLWRCWSNFRDALDATVWRCWSNFRDALDATVWRCWSNFRDALDATLWRCWSNFRDALDATLWRCWSNFRDALDATLWRCWSNFRDALDATLWRCWSNFRDALDATLWRCWSNFRDALDATLWRCWSNFRDALDATLWRCWSNFRDKIGLGLDLLQELGKLMKSINKKIGYWKWADRRCKKASNVFREYVFEIHCFQKSRFCYSENDTKLILRRASNVFEPFLNIDRARFMNKVLRFTGNCALNL